MKLNLGCGNKKLDGYLNVDSYEGVNPDKLIDLTNTPYPFQDNSVSEIIMRNLIEHFPQNPREFFSLIQEMYRISMPNAKVLIRCPHPNHRWQIEDLTHQKAFSKESFILLSKKECKKLIELKSSKTPLAMIYNIDFELVDYRIFLDNQSKKHITNILGSYDEKLLPSYISLFNNVAAVQEIELLVRK